jgi:hypothetical protein
LVDAGASAVAVLGSHARDEGHRFSDLDMIAIGSGDSRMRAFDGLLVSEQWLTEERAQELLDEPGQVGQVVPGWRSARVLHDPEGIIARLKQEADAWTWDRLGNEPDEEVAENVVGYCEEVYRLVGHVLARRWMAAAVMRSVLALRCASIMAVHLRLMYATENRLWSMVADAMGPEWKRAQEAAFGFDGEDVPTSSAAALRLFELTAAAAEELLDDDQRKVVTLAVRAIADCRSALS